MSCSAASSAIPPLVPCRPSTAEPSWSEVRETSWPAELATGVCVRELVGVEAGERELEHGGEIVHRHRVNAVVERLLIEPEAQALGPRIVRRRHPLLGRVGP